MKQGTLINRIVMLLLLAAVLVYLGVSASQPKSYVTENCVHSIYTPGYVHDPNHWFYLYTDEGSSFITVRDNWTEGEKYLQNANGPGNVWENNGPKVARTTLAARAGGSGRMRFSPEIRW